MFDQSFSPKNFSLIFDLENRKGEYLEKQFFPPLVVHLSQSIKECNDQFKELRKEFNSGRVSQEDFDLRRKAINGTQRKLKTKKDAIILLALQKYSEISTSGSFQIVLTKANRGGSAKPHYSIGRNPQAFFAMKQAQRNIQILYKTKQSSRYAIVSQLKELLSDGFPKCVIRTDIESFYETVDQRKLIEILTRDNILSFETLQLIRQVLRSYGQLAGTPGIGLPRGVGISAFLAEIYIRELDSTIRGLPEVWYYARYVDDIVLICNSYAASAIEAKIKADVEGDTFKLKLSSSKSLTLILDLHSPLPKTPLEYLGYAFHFTGTPDKYEVRVGLSAMKIKKYYLKIRRCFNSFLHERRRHESRAQAMLMRRIRFLTTNTRLRGRKGRILTGIFHSNSLLTSSEDLLKLDWYLQLRVESSPLPRSKSKRLQGYSFVAGFTEPRYTIFTSSELASIVKAWEHYQIK
jgi:hypothetical protein